MSWSVEFFDQDVQSSLDALPLDIRASFQRIVELIQSHGLERVREPYVKHLKARSGDADEGKGWNRSRSVRDGSREADCHRPCLRKETQKTPRREIEIALKRAKEVQ